MRSAGLFAAADKLGMVGQMSMCSFDLVSLAPVAVKIGQLLIEHVGG